jgi:complement component 1 Q subcomponent-binding protein, mitochondrial
MLLAIVRHHWSTQSQRAWLCHGIPNIIPVWKDGLLLSLQPPHLPPRVSFHSGVGGAGVSPNFIAPMHKNHLLVDYPSRWVSTQRSFSADATRKQLLKLITREYDEEIDKGTSLPSELMDVKKAIETDGWKIVDDPLHAVVKIHRTTSDGNTKIQISFHCQDTIEGFNPSFDNDGDMMDGDDENEPDEDAVPVRFTVTATRAGRTMYFLCMSEQAAVRIENVAMTSAQQQEVETLHSGKSTFDAQYYQGPEFTELAEDVQDSFQQYLHDVCGINDDVATFVAMYCDYKEQNQYVHFLKEAKTLLT